MDHLTPTVNLAITPEAVAKVTHQLCRLRQDPDSILSLAIAISDLQMTLSTCQRALEADSSRTHSSRQTRSPESVVGLVRAQEGLANLQSLALFCLKASNSGQRRQWPQSALFKWAKTSDDVVNLQQKLQNLKESLAQSLAQRQMVKLQQLFQESNESLGALLSALDIPTTSSSSQTQQDFSRRPNEIRLVNSENRLQRFPNGSLQSVEHDPQTISTQAASPDSTCGPWCDCCCHVRRRVQTTEALGSILGLIIINYEGLPMITPWCNQMRCLSRSNSVMKFFLYLPKLLSSKALLATYSKGPLASPELSLSVSRVISVDSASLWYCENNRANSLERLLKKGYVSPQDIDENGDPLLFTAVRHDAFDVANLLLLRGADIYQENSFGLNTTHVLLQKRLTGSIGYNLSSNALQIFQLREEVVDDCQFSQLHKCVLALVGSELERQLLVSTADIDAIDRWGRTPLHWAALRGDLPAITALLRCGACSSRTDVDGWTPIHAAAWSGCADAVRLLSASGCDINQANRNGNSPLHVASSSRDGNICVESLLRLGADVDKESKLGRTPLMEATRYHQQENAKRLLEIGANVNAKNRWGETVFLLGVRWDSIRCVRLLLENSADYLAMDYDDNSILHIAAWRSGLETLEVLESVSLRHLDVDAKNKKGETADDITYLRRRDGEWEESEEWHVVFGRLIEKIISDNDSSSSRSDFTQGTSSNMRSGNDRSGIFVRGRKIVSAYISIALSPCITFFIATASSIFTSLCVALLLSYSRDDISGGFTVGGYILAGTLPPIGFAYARHKTNCSCSKNGDRKNESTEENDDNPSAQKTVDDDQHTVKLEDSAEMHSVLERLMRQIKHLSQIQSAICTTSSTNDKINDTIEMDEIPSADSDVEDQHEVFEDAEEYV